MHKIAFLIASLTISGCGLSKVCTLGGCTDGVELVLSPSGDAGAGLAAGKYVVVVMADGMKSTTTCTVSATDSHCTSDPISWFDGVVDSEIQVFVEATSPSISVTVTLDGVQLAARTVAPDYHENKPNGPDCEPTCKQAQVTIPV